MLLKSEIGINAARAYNAKYDEAVKLLFQNPEIIAPILQMSVPEYKKYSVEEVITMIDKSSINSDPVDSASAMADSLPTEINSIGEKVIRYDSHFKAINPALSNNNIKFYLHIDLEVQNNYKPSSPPYPLIKRAIYYGAREISSQLGIITEETNYANLEKVYSIWICNENIPKNLMNTVTSYSITKKDEIGITDEPDSDYDLMTAIIIRRGDEAASGLFDYLEGIFKSSIDRINKYVDIKGREDIEEGVRQMTGLGESIFLKGINKGQVEIVAKMINNGKITIKEGAELLGISVEALQKELEKAQS